MNKNIDELNELRDKYNLLSEELNHQEIINDRFVKNAIDKGVKRVNKVTKQGVYVDVLTFIAFNFVAVGSKLYNQDLLNWGTIIFANVLLITEYIVNMKLHKILNIENIHSKLIKEYLLKIKEYREKSNYWRRIEYIVSIPLALMIAYDISNGNTYSFIFNTILLFSCGIVVDFFFERKMKKRIREIEDIINDINQV